MDGMDGRVEWGPVMLTRDCLRATPRATAVSIEYVKLEAVKAQPLFAHFSSPILESRAANLGRSFSNGEKPSVISSLSIPIS